MGREEVRVHLEEGICCRLGARQLDVCPRSGKAECVRSGIGGREIAHHFRLPCEPSNAHRERLKGGHAGAVSHVYQIA